MASAGGGGGGGLLRTSSPMMTLQLPHVHEKCFGFLLSCHN